MKKLKERAKQLKVDIPAVFIAMRHKRTPLFAKVLAAVSIGYFLSPIDLIPDFIPVLGMLDDLLIVPGLIALVVKLIPPDVFTECRQKSEDLWKDGKPKKWFYAVPIVLFWIAMILLVVYLIWRGR